MIKIKEAVIVEGKYDKIKLSSLIDGLIIETGATGKRSSCSAGWRTPGGC